MVTGLNVGGARRESQSRQTLVSASDSGRVNRCLDNSERLLAWSHVAVVAAGDSYQRAVRFDARDHKRRMGIRDSVVCRRKRERPAGSTPPPSTVKVPLRIPARKPEIHVRVAFDP